ncbi:MAG: BCCT family transporter [Firmicutes bacterium]|nr:BCCT family transporter [Bacillota bacterium]MBQ6810679.1 BCCT family transporter [Bacillota bacterium]
MFKGVDKTIFGVGCALFIALFAFILIVPDTAYNVITAAMNYTYSDLGWIYLLVFAASLMLCLFVGLSKYGKIKLGERDDKPQYSLMSWVGMLMGAGIGCGFVFYGVNEVVTHFVTSPFQDPETVQAARDAMRLTMLHWGILPWGIYTVTGLCIGWFMYKRNLPCLMSSMLYPVLGDKVRGVPGKIVDVFACVAVVCGVAMSTGFAGIQFMTGLNGTYGIANNFGMQAAAIAVFCAIGTFTAVKGVEKGIKIVSDINLYLIYGILVFAIIFGSTMFIFKCALQTMGDLFFNTPWEMFYTDAFGATTEQLGWDWVGGWTVFYWAWWAAFAPFTGGFLAKVSRGRTLRQFCLAGVLIPTIIGFFWFSALGGNAVQETLLGNSDIALAAAANKEMSLFLYFQELPLSVITVPVCLILIVTLIVTSINSATYCLSDFCMGHKGAGQESPFAIRLFWGIFIALFSILFLLIGGLQTLQNTSMVFAFPLILIIGVGIYCTMKDIAVVYKEEEALGYFDKEEKAPVAEEAKVEA